MSRAPAGARRVGTSRSSPRVAQPPHEGALGEAIRRLDRGRIGDGHQDRDVGRQPQVQRQRRIGRPEIDHDVVDVQRGDRRQRHLRRHARARRAERAAFAGDQPDARDGRVGDQLPQARSPCLAATRRSHAAARARPAAGAAGRPLDRRRSPRPSSPPARGRRRCWRRAANVRCRRVRRRSAISLAPAGVAAARWGRGSRFEGLSAPASSSVTTVSSFAAVAVFLGRIGGSGPR